MKNRTLNSISRNKIIAVIAGVLCALAIAAIAILPTAFSLPVRAEESETVFEEVTPFVGSDETEMNFNWLALPSTNESQSLYVIEQPNPEDDENFDYDEAAEFEAEMSESSRVHYSGNYRRYTATATDLKPDTRYAYCISDGENYSPVYSFVTGTDGTAMNFVVFGDAQLGTNGQDKLIKEDKPSWFDALKTADEQFSPSFIMHLGDEVESYTSNAAELPMSEEQYTVFYGSDVARRYAFANVIGNHEVAKSNWSEHHNFPNLSTGTQKGTEGVQGNDYWFVRGNVLVFVINSNNYNTLTHDKFLTDAIEAAEEKYGDRIEWKIAAMHHAMFGANHITKEEQPPSVRQREMSETISKHGIDLVFQAHEHVYCRSHMMYGLEADHSCAERGYYVSEAEGKKTLWVTAGSSTANKVFDADYIVNDHVAAYNDDKQSPQLINVVIRGGRLTVEAYVRGESKPFDEFTLYSVDPADSVPVIQTKDVKIKKGAKFSPLDGVLAYDGVEGDITLDVKWEGSVDTSKAGKYTLKYTVTTKFGKTAEATRNITVGSAAGCASEIAGEGIYNYKTWLYIGAIVLGFIILAVLFPRMSKKRGQENEIK